MLLRGSCWMQFEGDKAPLRIESGDVFLLCEPRSHVLGSDLEAERVDLADVLEGRVVGRSPKHFRAQALEDVAP